MSEAIYACLFRLFPSHFRETYGEAALQLFRDRARDEKGFVPSLRLWFDLLADLAISVPHEYFCIPARSDISARRPLDAIPSLRVLERESPGLGALLLGAALSLVAGGAFSIPMARVLTDRPPRAWVTNPQPPAYSRWSALSRPISAQADDVAEKTILSGPPAMAAILALGMPGFSQPAAAPQTTERRRNR